jgi:ChrR Cupin-like domain
MPRSHEPGQNLFHSVRPEDIDWQPFAALPSPTRLAVLVGQPSQPGPYVIRVKVPAGVKLMPHRHPEDRVYTVMSGVFYIGQGERFDEDTLQAYAPGSVVVLPGDTFHFHWAKSGEYVTQVTAIGPLGLEYRDPADDPRRHTCALPGAGSARQSLHAVTTRPARSSRRTDVSACSGIRRSLCRSSFCTAHSTRTRSRRAASSSTKWRDRKTRR